MKKIEVYGLKICEDINSETDLPKLIVKEAERQAYGIKENDVIVITSKIVSKAEGRFYRLSDVHPSRKSYILSKIFKRDAREIELILHNSDGIEFIIPIEKLARKYGKLFRSYVSNEEVARSLLRKDPYIFMTSVGGMLLTDAGLDFSNSPSGNCTLPPKDPDESARKIRYSIRELTGKDVAVFITDTEWKLDKFGTVDIAIGSSGIDPISRKFGAKDLYGKPKFGGVDNLTDLLSASANLLFCQTDESIPIAILRGFEYERREKGIKDVTYLRKVPRRVLRMLILENIKFRLLCILFNLKPLRREGE
ncbi:coenzyme F420-0:L-glutamate ligase [Candidatus Bathyarchaeota archaeon]|nr:coenzyme F420-0:L-glutamate ligase [Candidatus Bathyarchaeota archaeon]